MTTVTRPALLSALAYMLQATGVTVTELAQHMGVKLEAAPIALPPGQRLDLTGRPRLQETLKLADNPDGISVPEIQTLWGVGHQTAWMYLDELHRGLHVVRVKAPGVRGSRYFRDPGHASRWVDSHAQALAAERTRVEGEQQTQEAAQRLQAEQKAAAAAERQRRAAERAQKAQEKAAAPKPAPKPRVSMAKVPNGGIVIKAPEPIKLAGGAVETAATRRVIDTTKRPNSRVEAAAPLPPDPRWPSFSSTPLGVNPDTGRAWA